MLKRWNDISDGDELYACVTLSGKTITASAGAQFDKRWTSGKVFCTAVLPTGGFKIRKLWGALGLTLPRSLPSLFLLFIPLPSLLPLPLEVAPPIIQLGGLRERCELPQWGLQESPSRNRIWCILGLIWHLVTAVVMIFLRTNYCLFLCAFSRLVHGL